LNSINLVDYSLGTRENVDQRLSIINYYITNV